MDNVFALRADHYVRVLLHDSNWSMYRPRQMVRAVRMNEDFCISRNVDGEAVGAEGTVGDYIVEDDDGLRVVPGAEFEVTHEQIA